MVTCYRCIWPQLSDFEVYLFKLHNQGNKSYLLSALIKRLHSTLERLHTVRDSHHPVT